MLVAFGFDSLHIGQQKLFKGKRFASTDQASVIWFGTEGAEYSPDMAVFSDFNLLTAKPLVGVEDAMNLLGEYLDSEVTATAVTERGRIQSACTDGCKRDGELRRMPGNS